MGLRTRILSRVSPAQASPVAEENINSDEKSPHHSDVDDVALGMVQPGELTFEEDTAGGLGRHLGLTSTTFLM